MIERLKTLAALPLGRKVFLALVVSALAAANAKFGLGLDHGTLLLIAGMAGVVILGISIEDAGALLGGSKRPPGAPPAPGLGAGDPGSPPAPPTAAPAPTPPPSTADQRHPGVPRYPAADSPRA